jgi:carbon storage regulator
MLVLTRKLNERIFIGDDIVLKIVEIDRNKIKVGITAPSEVEIIREDLLVEQHPDDPRLRRK